MRIDNLEQFTDAFRALLEKNPARAELLRNGREMLSELVLTPDWFQPILTKLVLDEAFLKSQWQSIDSNDIQLYRSSDKLFSVRAYIWEPNVVYPIHDHGAWGIVGAHINQIRERKFVRTDGGSNEDYAEIKQTSEKILSPGETTFVLPVDEGIHQMQALDNKTAVTIHVYGAPIRKGFIRCFDLQSNLVQRMYPPSIAKKIFAIKTLGSIPESWAEDVLHRSINFGEPEYIQKECRDSLLKLKN
jgi:predicted metal-dependent enzyme (double-stranded beta helix superfamily)